MHFKYPISDLHIHTFTPALAEEALVMVDEIGYERFNLLSATSIGPNFAWNNLLCAWMKCRRPGQCFAFAGFLYPLRGTPDADDFLRQARCFRDMGFDGIKMMDGKPGIRRRLGVSLNDPAYDLMFTYLEDTGLPLVYHVGDPDEFWHYDQMPLWAKKQRRRLCYEDASYPSKDTIELELLEMLKKHPRLRIVLAHFFFGSLDLERMRQIFDSYPNFSVDITPGWEMFEGFSQRYEEWREFFRDYAGRIFYGTDTVSGHWRETLSCLRRVLETGEIFTAFEENCQGLNLPEGILRRIYKENFDQFMPRRPQSIDVAMLKKWAEEQRERLALIFCEDAIRAIEQRGPDEAWAFSRDGRQWATSYAEAQQILAAL